MTALCDRVSMRGRRPGARHAVRALLACALACTIAGAGAGVGCKRTRSREAAGGHDAAPAVVHAEPARQRIVVTNITVRTVDPPVARELHPRQLARTLGQELLGSGLFAASVEDVPEGLEPRTATLDVSVHYDVVEADHGGGLVVMVGVECGLAWEEEGARDPAPWDQLLVERPVREGVQARDHDGLVAALADDAVRRLGLGLVERERVRAGGEAALAQVLADPEAEPTAVRWALDLIAYRRVQSLFDQVAGKLEAEAVEVRQRAVTVLAALGGARALAAITERVRFDDTESLGVAIDTVAALGGEDARAYLEFVASGHPDDAVRAHARAALARVAPGREAR